MVILLGSCPDATIFPLKRGLPAHRLSGNKKYRGAAAIICLSTNTSDPGCVESSGGICCAGVLKYMVSCVGWGGGANGGRTAPQAFQRCFCHHPVSTPYQAIRIGNFRRMQAIFLITALFRFVH
ncbi:hypothetical protein KCP70_09330 [Salmonella enterica subsp. enterica]|nr:hypothetical protein KCP70_09330 [Salmonella enterica subsp. enterica]